MVVLLLALLLISAVALSVVAAFAMPHLRAGSPVLTDKGERVARRVRNRLRPVTGVLGPRLRPVTRAAGRAVAAAARPLVTALRPRVAPLTQAISRAVEEGTAPTPVVRRPAAAPSADGAAAGAPVRSGVLRITSTVRAPAPRPAAAPAPLARR